MVAASCTISGTYLVSDKTGIAEFLLTTHGVTSTALSQASIFVIPAGGNKVNIGVLEA